MSNNVENRFNLAANYIQSHHHEINKNDLLQFYAFYKQATSGILDTKTHSRPSFFKLQDRAKYDAWNSLGSMDKTQAMGSYVSLLSNLFPEWIESVSHDEKGSSGSFGASVSRPRPKVEKLIDDSEKSIEDFIREGNTKKLEALLKNVDPNELNSLDENGLSLIHWASDRGNLEILKVILNIKGIDINLQDSEGQTAVFYASSCGHKTCVQLLLDHGANKEILDNEGNSCIDVAYNDEIKKIFG